VKKIRFFVFGYRDQYFWSEFGPIVRDLMMVSSLADDEKVDKVIFYNRPVSIHERILRKKNTAKLSEVNNKIEFTNSNSYDILGPLKKRAWVKEIYKSAYATSPLFDSNYINIVLDFLPIGELPGWAYNADLYWYDLIDNFVKHNRYTPSEKQMVKDKYSYIKQLKEKSLVTGVTGNAIEGFSNSHVIENAILKKPELVHCSVMFDFGFMGFITNKFDIETIKVICNKGYTVAIYGEAYDLNIIEKLKQVDGVSVFGKFTSGESDIKLSSFKVGLIPYKNELLHDESPLKLYQYLLASKPVLSSYSFDFEHTLFHVYTPNNLSEKIEGIINLKAPGKHDISKDTFLWSARIKDIVNIIMKRVNKIDL